MAQVRKPRSKDRQPTAASWSSPRPVSWPLLTNEMVTDIGRPERTLGKTDLPAKVNPWRATRLDKQVYTTLSHSEKIKFRWGHK
jgi:hypothetical protein